MKPFELTKESPAFWARENAAGEFGCLVVYSWGEVCRAEVFYTDGTWRAVLVQSAAGETGA